jgi:transposase
MVTQALVSDVYTGDVVIFRSKRSDRLKLLIWDGSGLSSLPNVSRAGRLPGRRCETAR